MKIQDSIRESHITIMDNTY